MKLLLEHLKNNREALQKYSDVISSARHSVNLGAARESLISNFLTQNLPEFISYHSGEVFDSNERRSGQIDIVLHPITSPKLNLYNSVSIFPAETVLAAIEVKSTLTTGKSVGSLVEALKSCEKLKGLEIFKNSNDSPVVDPQRVPFIVFAFKGPTLETLKKHLNKHSNIRELPDLILVLDKGYCLVKDRSWHNILDSTISGYSVSDGQDEVLVHLFKYIIGIVEYWSANPSDHTMPIEKYTKNMTTLYDLMEF